MKYINEIIFEIKKIIKKFRKKIGRFNVKYNYLKRITKMALKKVGIRELNVLINSFLAGICVCLGTTVFLSLNKGPEDQGNKCDLLKRVAGSIYFAFALFIIINFKMWLFTGKVGFIIENVLKSEWLFFLDLFVCLIGNILGATGLTLLLRLTQICKSKQFTDFLNPMINSKRTDEISSMFILGCYCGFMIYIAVRGSKIIEGDFTKALFIFLAVVVFVCSTFEHSIADCSYFAWTGFKDTETNEGVFFKDIKIVFLLAFANLIGSVLLDLLIQLAVYFSKRDEEMKLKGDQNIENFE